MKIVDINRKLAAGLGAVIALAVVAAGSHWVAQGQTPTTRLLARGAGTTMLEGGSGAPDFLPVFTKIAFHAQIVNGVVQGAFECLAVGPQTKKGTASANFTDNIMYVTGNVETARIEGDSIRLTGNSECTGIGEGSNVPYEAVIKRGGPGATIWLRGGSPPQIFKEILVEGNFDVVNQ